MKAEQLINRTSFTSLDDSPLDTFSTNAAVVLSDGQLYPLVKDEAAALLAASGKYHVSLSKAMMVGGTANKEAKDADKQALYDAHEAAILKLEATVPPDDKQYLTRPGYTLAQKGGPKTAKVMEPTLQSSESKKVRGRVRFILKAEFPREIKGIIGRRTLDGNKTWEEGNIKEFKLNFTLEGQPSGQRVGYQFKFVATNNRTSDWSETFDVDVF